MAAIRHAELERGKEYKNRGGGTFKCISREHRNSDAYYMQNTASRWTFMAHVITLYDDGTIEWDYSTGGTFENYYL